MNQSLLRQDISLFLMIKYRNKLILLIKKSLHMISYSENMSRNYCEKIIYILTTMGLNTTSFINGQKGFKNEYIAVFSKKQFHFFLFCLNYKVLYLKRFCEFQKIQFSVLRPESVNFLTASRNEVDSFRLRRIEKQYSAMASKEECLSFASDANYMQSETFFTFVAQDRNILF